MAYRRDAGLERAQIAALSRLGIDFPRVEAESARSEFANHGVLPIEDSIAGFDANGSRVLD
jgi:hypothetical protein